MVKITKVESNRDYVMVEFLTSGITISTRVYQHDKLTPQEIAESAYNEIKPHIQQECDRTGVEADHLFPIVTDEVVRVEILGAENINYTEGSPNVEKTFRCVGHTLFGKSVNITDDVAWTPGRTLDYAPTSNETKLIGVSYNGLTCEKSFDVYFRSLADVEAERLAEKEQQEETEKQKVISEKLARMEEIKWELARTDYKAIKFIEGFYTAEQYDPIRLARQVLRDEYNSIEAELVESTVSEMV